MRSIEVLWLLSSFLAGAAYAGDQPQWGERYSRNMISSETGLPEAFDPRTGAHVLWSVPLGGNGYCTPIVAAGKVLIGANNAEPRDPRHQGDRGVLLCLNENDGSLCWQLMVPRIAEDHRMDWPEVSMCSPPTVEGDRVYVLSNRYEVMCLDLAGLANGNDGPYQEEGRHMAPQDEPAMEPGPTDADILWIYDLPGNVGIYMHDSAFASILLDGPYLYLNTCNGVDNPSHEFVRRPEAPSLVVLETVWRFDYDPSAPKENFKEYVKSIKEDPSGMLAMPVFYKNRVYVAVGGDIWWGKRQAWLKCIDATQ